MAAIPEVVTHRYDPARGICRNVCSLADVEAALLLDRLRRESRPTLKPDYLARRRATERWLHESAAPMLGRSIEPWPAYFFLGDFSYFADPSRPASLVVPLASLRADAITFTLGDSMRVAQQANPRMYRLDEMLALFEEEDAIAEFGFSDQAGVQTHFIEVQVWDRSSLSAWTS